MSYLSQLVDGKLSPVGFLKQSVGYMLRKVGLSDDKIEALEKEGHEAIDTAVPAVSATLSVALAQAFPMISKETRDVIARQAAEGAALIINTSISALGAKLEELNDDPKVS